MRRLLRRSLCGSAAGDIKSGNSRRAARRLERSTALASSSLVQVDTETQSLSGNAAVKRLSKFLADNIYTTDGYAIAHVTSSRHPTGKRCRL